MESEAVKKQNMSGKTIKRIIFGIAGVVLGLMIAFANPAGSLAVGGMRTLGIFIWAVTWWIGGVLPDWVTGMAMITLFSLTGCATFAEAFGQFSSDTFWLMMCAIILGYAVGKSGLLKRIVLNIMKLLPATYTGQLLALLIGGTVISPMIPTNTAKSGMAAPFAAEMCRQLGLEKKSKPAAGLCVAMFLGFCGTSPLFMSGTFLNYTAFSVLPADVQAQFSWLRWMLCMLVWGVVFIVGSYFFLKIFYAPKEKISVSREYVNTQLKEISKISRDETITLCSLILVLALWIAQQSTGIPAGTTALFSLIILGATGVIKVADIRQQPWDVMMFTACIIALGTVFKTNGITTWISELFAPIAGPVFSNKYLMIIILSVLLYVVRLFLVSQTTMATLFPMLMAPFCLAVGISPWILAPLTVACSNSWVTKYQNVQALVGWVAYDDLCTWEQYAFGSVGYIVLSTIGFLASVPFWTMLGLMP